MTAAPVADVGGAYPETRRARDRFVVERRGDRQARDPFVHQGVLVEDEPDAHGRLTRTATVFLTGRECPWRCVMCDLWQYTTVDDTPPGAIPLQIRAAVALLPPRAEAPVAVKLYNAGSFFDPRAVPETDDPAIVDALAPFSHVIVESHPALVGARTWRLRDALGERGISLEVAMGLETAHPQALDAINKGLTVERFASAASALAAHGVSLRTFLLVHPPFVPRGEQRAWLSRSVGFADDCGAAAISLIPSRGGEGALEAIAHAAGFAPPLVRDVEEAACVARAATSARVFVDLWDFERVTRCTACALSRHERLRQFNLTQKLGRADMCDACGEVPAS